LVHRQQSGNDFEREHPGLTSLTPMERRVLRLIASDLSSKEIAAQLFVSPRTVETHRQNIANKLELHGSLALVRFALANAGKL
ncbi:MAG: helix-turn-helix transcriptional regulator, partial [Verrucomicrobiota bacterium]|nr:helix-turn-helix transcriptional regulator [Verrucomicrobiota bacterium]